MYIYQVLDTSSLTMDLHCVLYIEDIYFFEVNTKYISLSISKTSELLRVRSTSENSDVFNSHDEIYLVFAKKK